MTETGAKLNVAILDDYQNVSHRLADWKKLSDRINLDIFNNFIGKDENLSRIYYRIK